MNDGMVYVPIDEEIKPSGDPLKLRGLMTILENEYEQGMTLNDFQMAVGIPIQKELKESLDNLSPEEYDIVWKFLQNVNYNLDLDNKRAIRSR